MAIALDANLGTVTNSASLTTSAAAASNSRVILFVWYFESGGTCTGASGGGLTWVVDREDEWVGNGNIACLSADAPSGLASSTSITPSFSSAVDFGPGLAAASFTGLETGASGYVDVVSGSKHDFNETYVTNTLVTTVADTLLVSLSAVNDGSGHTATAPATELHEWTAEGTNFAATMYRIVSSTGTYTLGGVWGGVVFFQQNIGIAYKAGTGEPPPAGPTLRTVQSNMRIR